MKLLFVGTNRGGGGTESHFITIVSAMAASGHDVSAVVWPDEFIHRALADDARVRLYPARFRVRNDIGATRDVMRIARTLKPDWIIGTFKREYWPLGIASRLLRTPLVLFSHLDQRMQPLMVHGLPRLVRRIIAPSEYQRSRLVARGMRPAKITVLYNPIDTRHFRVDARQRATTRARLGFGDDDVVVSFIGRQEHGKGVTVLADAVHRVMDEAPNVRMLWLGHAGDDSTDLHERAAQSHHASHHTWEPWAADVAPYLAASDIVALPSIGPETFGRVLVEAQACGVPVLGSRLGGIPETMLEGETGLLLPPGDAGAWADAIGRLARDACVRERMGRAGRAFAEDRFSSPHIADEFGRMLAALH